MKTTRAGLARDPLTAGKVFISWCQLPGEKAEDFANDLKKIFKDAYPDEELTSVIQLQRFLTGLVALVSRQMLLHGQPTTFEQAVKDAKAIEYALNFETESTAPVAKEVNAISLPHPLENAKLATQLQQALESMTKRRRLWKLNYKIKIILSPLVIQREVAEGVTNLYTLWMTAVGNVVNLDTFNVIAHV